MDAIAYTSSPELGGITFGSPITRPPALGNYNVCVTREGRIQPGQEGALPQDAGGWLEIYHGATAESIAWACSA